MKDILKHIDSLKAAFDKLKPLTAENQQKLDKKLRLEWNYNSNHIEGNTLTYGETELLLIFGETKGNHEFREYEEMKGHDVALKLLEDLAADKERNLSENFIREINRVILKEPFYKAAITQDGQPTRRLIKIGEYKSHPNSVLLQNGEMFHYASPAETPAAMSDLLAWYNEAAKNNTIHPVELAAVLHYKFVCIHPFDDGNGRISRLIMNYHLLKNGYPPVIIKSADKKNYLFALHEADTGNLNAFKEYIAEQLVWSCEISIKAAKGESIDEAGDWEKKLKLLDERFKSNKTLKYTKSNKTITEAINKTLIPLFNTLLNKDLPINTFFLDREIIVMEEPFHPLSILTNQTTIELFVANQKQIDKALSKKDFLEFYFRLIDFKKNGEKSFTITMQFHLYFSKYSYKLNLVRDLRKSELIFEKMYHDFLSESDLDHSLNIITDSIISQIDLKTKGSST